MTDPDKVAEMRRTTCCVVGGGPGGLMMALLLARQGVAVTLLEAHQDFDRNFRGDTLHPALLEILDDLGLADRLLQLPHFKLFGPVILTRDGPVRPLDFTRLRTRFPFILAMPQEKFLDFLATEAQKYPTFRLVMGANVQRLVEENGIVRGVRYQAEDGWHEVRADLVVGADGRFSRLRHLAGFKPIKTSSPIQILWFRLPQLPDDSTTFSPEAANPRAFATLWGVGHPPGSWLGGTIFPGGEGPLIVIHRIDHWQLGYLFFRKDHYQELRSAGLEAFRRRIVEQEPRFVRHVEHLTDWHQLMLLSVEFSHVRRWFKPGLLLIGDAAHVMTPAAGSGIKYAMEDAVVAANVLAKPLRLGRITVADLAEVQRRREWPTWFIQTAGGLVQRFVGGAVSRARPPVRLPWWVRLLLNNSLVRGLLARTIGVGLWRVRVRKRAVVRPREIAPTSL